MVNDLHASLPKYSKHDIPCHEANYMYLTKSDAICSCDVTLLGKYRLGAHVLWLILNGLEVGGVVTFYFSIVVPYILISILIFTKRVSVSTVFIITLGKQPLSYRCDSFRPTVSPWNTDCVNLLGKGQRKYNRNLFVYNYFSNESYMKISVILRGGSTMWS